MKKIVLTGGTHVWKTSIIKNLQFLWYTAFESVAEKNMQLLIDLLWLEVYQKWRNENFLDFQRMIFFSNLQVYNESLKITNPKEWIIFYDRWVFDWFASLKREWIDVPIALEKQTENINYDMVFLIESLPYHDMRENEWRMLNEEMSKKWESFLIKEYQERFGNIIRIPAIYYPENKELAIQERTNLILSKTH